MSTHEPVNIMGVVAFPNPDKEEQSIRFIDSSYNTLFTIRNGESIVLTGFEGRHTVMPCTYIDGYHAKIGSSVFHICEFAELAERNGAVYEPEVPVQGASFGLYEVYQITPVADTSYCFRSYEEAKSEINPSDYHRAYAGMLAEGVTLENLWAKHNRDSRPFGRQMRSMSMSDIVVIRRGGEKKAYYADTFGFAEAKEFFKDAPQKSKRRNELGKNRRNDHSL